MKNIILVLSSLFIIACGDSNEIQSKNENKSINKSKSNTQENKIENDPFNLPYLNGVESPTKDIQHIK